MLQGHWREIGSAKVLAIVLMRLSEKQKKWGARTTLLIEGRFDECQTWISFSLTAGRTLWDRLK